ncbi:MAG: DUF2267 domain-containing protein [Candidatus Promineifilaceae bacterium]|nr:DUF2267 domain-containing protein [Candidatus Promineifilaceae bacterium]
MQHEEFLNEVQLHVLRNHAIRLSNAEAANATEAVLQTLAEQFSEADRATLAEKLPPELQDFWEDAGTAESLTLNGFFQRLAERMSIDVTVATYYARAVTDTLSELLSSDDLDDLRARLPERFAPLFDRGAGGELGTAL